MTPEQRTTIVLRPSPQPLFASCRRGGVGYLELPGGSLGAVSRQSADFGPSCQSSSPAHSCWLLLRLSSSFFGSQCWISSQSCTWYKWGTPKCRCLVRPQREWIVNLLLSRPLLACCCIDCTLSTYRSAPKQLWGLWEPKLFYYLAKLAGFFDWVCVNGAMTVAKKALSHQICNLPTVFTAS